MKKYLFLLILCLTALTSHAQSFVDLGLPSGTLWKDKNEAGGFYDFFTFDEALNQFGNKLPTKEQLQELKDTCTWIWTGNGYKVIGPNGCFIFLPAAGYHDMDGHVQVMRIGKTGDYWSATPCVTYDGMNGAWTLGFGSSSKMLGRNASRYGQSVRLVEKPNNPNKMPKLCKDIDN